MPRDAPDDEPDDEHDYSLTSWRLRQLEARQKASDRRLEKLESWKNWVLGAAAAVSLFVGIFAKQAWSYLSGHP